MHSDTSVALLKAYGANLLPNMPTLPQLLSCWIREKEYNPEVVARLASISLFGKIMQFYFMGGVDTNTYDEVRGAINNVGRNIVHHMKGREPDIEPYIGNRIDNLRVDHAVSEGVYRVTRYGGGSSDKFEIHSTDSIPADVAKVEIAVIGHGAAGILVERTLRSTGFKNVTVYEKSKSLGIWANENVYSRSRNNPQKLSWHGSDLAPAPGTGDSVKEFLSNIGKSANIKAATIKSIKPSSLQHRIEFVENTIENKTVPIVINCSGLGTPRPISDSKKMATKQSTTFAGERWQRKLDAGECRGKSFIFIGLGNSTAEMIRQIHEHQDRGVEVDYRIMTHYPKDSVENPEDVVESKGGVKYRVFRDLSLPNLTSWQGDLGASRYDYYRALRTKKIISGVKSWRTSDTSFFCQTNRGSYRQEVYDVDKLFTLIGYQPSKLALEHFGIQANEDDQCPELDYDGEVQTGDIEQGHRLHRGYFCFGAMTANPQNKNAIVLPGMLFRLNDLITSVILRAAEVSLQSS